MADRGAATRPQSAWERWQEAHLTEEALAQRLDHGLSVLGWLAVLALGVYVYRLSPDVVGQALLLVPILICLAARDWLSGAARALPELSRLPLRRSRVEALLADPGSKAESFPPQPGNTPVDLAFEAYRWRRGDRRGLPLTIRLKSPGLILLEASSGAGKSSLFEAMLGLIPENGGWRLNGIDSQRLSAPARRAWFHLCEQFGHVFSDTLAANLRLARPEASDADCQAALRWAGLDEWATDAGLNTWIGEPGRPLSGGEQKRLILARAWLRDAPVWLIDEPFEGLDEALQERLAERLQALSRQRLLIVASHRVPSGLAPDGCIRQ
nr:ATP-binding cassette domain-containing protein [Microbulbifer rhizosphaerae]